MSTKKIFENYFAQNERIVGLESQDDDAMAKMITKAGQDDDAMAKMITKAVNDILSGMPDDSPIKNRETGLNLMAAIKKELQNPERLASVVDDVAGEIGTKLTETKKIKVNIS